MFTSLPARKEQHRMGQFLTTLKGWLSSCNQNKRKTVTPHITHLIYSLVFLLTISLLLVANFSHSKRLSSLLFVFCMSSLCSYTLHLQSYRNHVKEISGNFKNPARVGLAVLKKTVIFWKFQNGSINLLRIAREESWFSYSLDNVVKICLYRINISENIKIEHAFLSKAFFHFSSNHLTSCLSAFKYWTQ